MPRIAAAHALERDKPARAAEAGNAERLARRGGDPPARDGGGALGRDLDLRRPAKHEGGDSRAFGGELQPLRGGGRVFADLADHPGETAMAKAFLHRQQDVGVAARLEMDHAVGMESGEMERGGEQIAPSEAPEDRAFKPREDSGQEDRRAGIVCELGATGDLVEHAGRKTAPGQMGVDRRDPERTHLAAPRRSFDFGDARAQLGNDGCLAHYIEQTRKSQGRSVSVLRMADESSSVGRNPSIRGHSALGAGRTIRCD